MVYGGTQADGELKDGQIELKRSYTKTKDAVNQSGQMPALSVGGDEIEIGDYFFKVLGHIRLESSESRTHKPRESPLVVQLSPSPATVQTWRHLGDRLKAHIHGIWLMLLLTNFIDRSFQRLHFTTSLQYSTDLQFTLLHCYNLFIEVCPLPSSCPHGVACACLLD